MHEFSLANQEFASMNTVLCVIYKQNKGSGSVCEEANGRGLKRAFYSTSVHYKKRTLQAAFFWAAFLKTRPKTA